MESEIDLHNCMIELKRDCKKWCKRLKRESPEVGVAKPHIFENEHGGVSSEIHITGSYDQDFYVGYRVRKAA